MINKYENEYREEEKTNVNDNDRNNVYRRSKNGIVEEVKVPDDTEEE